jgi:hypothetical protein
MASGRCRVHGGASLRGEQHPNYKHGGRSKSFLANLPKEFRERFKEAMADPELLSHRREVALYHSRILEALDRWGQFDTAGYRSDLRSSWQEFERANALPADTEEARQAKVTAVGAALGKFKRLIDSGGEETEAWLAVDAAIKSKLAAATAEHKRLVDMKQMLTVEQALEIIVGINEILQTRLRCQPQLLSLIGNDLERRFALSVPRAAAVIEGRCLPERSDDDHGEQVPQE